jgi:hypothetical protein
VYEGGWEIERIDKIAPYKEIEKGWYGAEVLKEWQFC